MLFRAFLFCAGILAIPLASYCITTTSIQTYTFKKLWQLDTKPQNSHISISNDMDSLLLKSTDKKPTKTTLIVCISKSFQEQNNKEIKKVLKSLVGTYQLTLTKKKENITDFQCNVVTIVFDEKDFSVEKTCFEEIANALKHIQNIQEEYKAKHRILMIVGTCVAPIWSFCKNIQELTSSPFGNLVNTIILLNPIVTQEMHDLTVKQFLSLASKQIYSIYSKPEYKVSTLFSWAMGNNNKRKMKPVMGKRNGAYQNKVQNILMSLYNSETYDMQNWHTKEVQEAIKLIPFFTQNIASLFNLWPDLQVNITLEPTKRWTIEARNDIKIIDCNGVSFNNNEWIFRSLSDEETDFANLFIKEKKITYNSAYIG